MDTDAGRPLADIRRALSGIGLLADALAVFDSFVPIELMVSEHRRHLVRPAEAGFGSRGAAKPDRMAMAC